MNVAGESSTVLDFDAHLAAITTAASRVVDEITNAGLSERVPTCPDWTGNDLLGHLGMVHRWASTVVADALLAPDIPEPEIPADGRADWLLAGADALVDTLREAPEDLRAFVFLKQAAPAKYFWARRQTHETTIHAVDALSARLGRLPTTKESAIPVDLAVDGLDELLTGFAPRTSSQLRADRPTSFVVAPSDADAAWTVRLSEEPPETVRGGPGSDEPDAVMSGSAAALYLGLHNRGDEIAVTGEPELLGVWRDKMRITWR